MNKKVNKYLYMIANRFKKCWFCKCRARKEYNTIKRKTGFIVEGKPYYRSIDKVICKECRAYLN